MTLWRPPLLLMSIYSCMRKTIYYSCGVCVCAVAVSPPLTWRWRQRWSAPLTPKTQSKFSWENIVVSTGPTLVRCISTIQYASILCAAETEKQNVGVCFYSLQSQTCNTSHLAKLRWVLRALTGCELHPGCNRRGEGEVKPCEFLWWHRTYRKLQEVKKTTEGGTQQHTLWSSGTCGHAWTPTEGLTPPQWSLRAHLPVPDENTSAQLC